MDFGKPWELEKIDPENKYIISTRCRTARSLKSFPFNQKMTNENYLALEKFMKNILGQLTGDLKGEYLSLSEMSEEKKNELIDSHFLFEASNKLLVAGNADKYFPAGRGIFMNHSKTFMVWVGEEDHLRLISLEQGSEIKNVVRRLEEAIRQLSTNIDFVRTKELGFISTCPANLGTGIRCSILAKLPKLSADMNKFKELAKKHNLQIRGEYGVNSVSKNPIYDLSNVRKYGITEREIIDIVVKGCKAILEEA
ncbi:MAG: hypothetical protein MHPSP_002631 [Paramarteilia canceri]